MGQHTAFMAGSAAAPLEQLFELALALAGEPAALAQLGA
jgi:hypothetical protein